MKIVENILWNFFNQFFKSIFLRIARKKILNYLFLVNKILNGIIVLDKRKNTCSRRSVFFTKCVCAWKRVWKRVCLKVWLIRLFSICIKNGTPMHTHAPTRMWKIRCTYCISKIYLQKSNFDLKRYINV